MDRRQLTVLLLASLLVECVRPATGVVDRSPRVYTSRVGRAVANSVVGSDALVPAQDASSERQELADCRVPQVDRLTPITGITVVNPERTTSEPIRLLLGNFRAELASDGRITFGRDRTARSLKGAAQDGEGRWIFLSGDGLAVRSETYLGPLARLAETTRYIYSVTASAGTIAVINGLNQGFLVSPMAMRVWPEFAALSAVSLSPSLGAYIDLDHHAWWLRADGQRNPIALRRHPARSLEVHQGVLHVRTSAGLLRVGEDGLALPIDERTLPQTRLTSMQEWTVLQALFDQYPSTLWSLVPDGTVNFSTASIRFGRDLAKANVQTRQITHIEREFVQNPDCEFESWGPHLIETCPHSLSLVTDAQQRRPLLIPSGLLHTIFSDDGVHAISDENCHPTSARRRTRAPGEPIEVCYTNDSGIHWQSTTLGLGTSRIHHVRSKYALVETRDQGRPVVALFDLDAGISTPLRSIAPTSVTDPRLAWAQFAADGHIWALFLSENSRQASFYVAQWSEPSATPTYVAMVHRREHPTAILGFGQAVHNLFSDGEWRFALNLSAEFIEIEPLNSELLFEDDCSYRVFSRPLLQCSTSECINGPYTVLSFVRWSVQKTPLLGTTQHYHIGGLG